MKQENQRELEAMIESEYSHIAGLTVQKGGRLLYEPVSYTHLTLPTICSV